MSLAEKLKELQQRSAQLKAAKHQEFAATELQSLRCGDTAGRAAIRQRWGCTVPG